MGKTDKRLHARTQASDFGDRWAATFGERERTAGAKYVVGRGWVVPCDVPPLHQQTGEGRFVCCWGCNGWHDVGEA